jgi:peptidyl-prolyl cis-trans isomerase C
VARRREPSFALDTSDIYHLNHFFLHKGILLKKLLPLFLLLALVLAACSPGSGSVAATIDGDDVTVRQVEDLIDTEESTIPKDAFAQFLGFEIQWRIIESAAMDEFDIEISEDEITAEADRIYESTNQGESREEFVASRGVTELFLQNIAQQALIDSALLEAIEPDVEVPSQEEIDAELASSTSNLTTVCVSHILVATEEEAEDAFDRVTDGGEEFGVVAAEVSTDPGSAESDGVLPCSPAGQYVEEFRDASLIAPIGEVYEELVQTQFGFHVMLVTDRQDAAEEDLPTEEEIADSLRQADVREAVNTWFFDAVAAADVVVEEEYGTWSPDPPQPGVTPPAA